MKAVTVEEHVFIVADLEVEDPTELIRTLGIMPVMAYTDPPWNAGIASTFRRMAGDPRKVDLDRLLRRVALAHAHIGGDVWIEFSADHSRMDDAMRVHGFEITASYNTTYERGGRPESLTLYRPDVTFSEFPPPPLRLFDGGSNSNPAVCIAASSDPGDYVFDACTGFGMTSRAAIAAGRKFVGSELNAQRLERAITQAERATKHQRKVIHE